MNLLRKLRNIHPGWIIGGFFVTLVSVNVSFFVIAFSHDVQMVERPTNAEIRAIAPTFYDPGDPDIRPPSPGDLRVVAPPAP